MANNNNEGADNNLDSSKDAGLDKSFVGKFVTGLINNTPLSKWFGKDPTTKSVVRRRDEEDDEDDASYVFQPPVKRAKLPSNADHNNYSAHVFESPVTVHNASNNINNVSSKVFGKFPEPVAGPSGIKSRKLFEKHSTSVSTNTVSNSFDNQDVNGDNDSDSEASTSGYSSAPKLSQEKSKQSFNSSNTETSENPTPKCRSLFTSTTDPSPSRSLFAERSPQMNTSLSSRRPAFNASTFGSPSFVDKTLSTRRILDSPFYSGSTIYGGASAYGRRLGKHGETSNNSRVSVQIKPVNAKAGNDSTTLSKTARRILTTLEQYSTPISDAKKIPVTPKKQGILSKYVGATPYATRDRKRPSNRELQVPTVPELLQMKQKERLQNSTESVRQIATSSKSTLNKDEYKLRTEDDNKQKHCNKMKNNVISVRQKAQPVELVDEVKLPKVSLPITTLPKFDFVMMTSQSSSEASTSPSSSKPLMTTVSKPAAVVELKKQDKISENGKINHFTFSEPLIIAKDLKAVSAINCFKFSEPLCKKQSVTDNFKAGDKNIFGGPKTKNNGESVIKPTNQLVTGSVMDILGKKDESTSQSRFRDKPTQSTWECDTCLVKNDIDKTRCVACDEPKPQGQSEQKETVGDQFKLSSDKWECSSCMVRNNNSDKNCVACANAKPGDFKPASASQIGFGDKFKPPASSWECTSCLIRNKNELDKCAACGVAKSGKKTPQAASWGDKFKPSGDTWECSSCMIRNKNDLDKCQACETPKPGAKVASKAPTFTFGDKFKAPPETWECPTCMIRNKNEVVKCSACETVKPGHKLLLPSTSSSTSTMFSFGIKPLEWECKTCLIKNKNDSSKCAACGISKDAPQPEKKGFGEAFKAKEGEWECSSCLVRNKPGIDACACCGVARTGGSEKASDAGKEAEKKPVISFNFGINKSSPVQFKFGIPATKNEESKQEVAVVSSSSSATPAPTSTTTPVAAFTFGTATKTTASVTSGTFSFGVNTQEKTEPAKSITSTSETVTPSVVNNPLLKPTEKLPEKAALAPVGFKFGLDSSNLSQKNDSQKPVSSENLVTSTSKTETPVFSTRFEPPKPTPTFQFKPAAINGDINKPKETLFASKPVESNRFVNASIPTTFKFNPQPAENTAPAPGAAQAEAKAPVFKFGADSQTPVKKTFGETNDGAVSNGFASPPKIPAFGSPQGFGATPSKPFSFGATDATPKNPTFSFGQSEKPSANPVFNFGGGASSTPSSGFNFSASTSTSTGFNFGAGAKVESQAQPFSAPAPAPAPAPTSVFGTGAGAAGKNGSFNFGTNANNNNQKAIFSFGASQTNQPSFGTPPSQSGFNFGAPAPPTIPPGGFTFTGAQPSFNFTDGSTSGVPPQRKIKKALRRTHR